MNFKQSHLLSAKLKIDTNFQPWCNFLLVEQKLEATSDQLFIRSGTGKMKPSTVQTTSKTPTTTTPTTSTSTTTTKFLTLVLLLAGGCRPSESIYSDHVTMQLEYSSPDDLAGILQDVKRVARTCSLLDDYSVQGLSPTSGFIS